MSKKSNTLAAAVATAALAALTTDQLGALSSDQVQAISTTEVQALTSDQVQALSTDQLGALAESQADPVTVELKLRLQVSTEELNVHTMRLEPKVEIVEKDLPTSAPEELVLAIPHAFYDEADNMRSWSAGQSITDPEEMMLLIERGAVFKG